MDWIDDAQARTERERAACEARIRDRTRATGCATCVACGELIEPARRHALPWAVRCVECQSELERRRS